MPLFSSTQLKVPALGRKTGSQQPSSCFAYSLARGIRTCSTSATSSCIFYSTPKYRPGISASPRPNPPFSPSFGQFSGQSQVQWEAFRRAPERPVNKQLSSPRQRRVSAGFAAFSCRCARGAPAPPAPRRSEGAQTPRPAKQHFKGCCGGLLKATPAAARSCLALWRTIINTHNLTHSS